MLTSPVNVAIPTHSVAGLKAHATGADASAGKNLALPPVAIPAPEANNIEPELPSSSALTTVNAFTATVASRTVLQNLTLNLANLLKLTRNDENLTGLFIRIIAAIEAMPQSERLQTEVRTGLKGMKITLWELAAALRSPDGAEAARLTAMIEAPLATPSKTSANAATSTYLQQGTTTGQTEETLAMRAAARSNAAGLGLFSPENKSHGSDRMPVDAKGLQNQLKTLFEPGASERRTESGDAKATPGNAAAAKVAPRADGSESRLATTVSTVARADSTMIHAENLKIDAPTAEKLHQIAKTIVHEQLAHQDTVETKFTAKAEATDHRMQTMLTLKGLAEVITSLPGKAAELFAAPTEAAQAEPAAIPNPADLKTIVKTAGSPEFASEIPLRNPEEIAERSVTASHGDPASDVVVDDDDATELAHGKAAAVARQNAATQADINPAITRPAVTHEGVPFAYAVVQPGKDAFAPKVEEEDSRDPDEQDSMRDEDEADGEKRRPRDEYDAMKDPQPEEEPAIVITRDSSEADRAFALYQRMGGF